MSDVLGPIDLKMDGGGGGGGCVCGGVETEQRGNQSETTGLDGEGGRFGWGEDEGQKVLTGNIFEFLFNS